MRSFLIKISLFCLPVILYCILPTWVLYTTRENFYNADRFIDDLVENENQYLIGYVYNDQASKYIKYRVLNKLPRQGVVALGSSRAEEFRSEMFDMDFYNAGYMIRKLKEFQVFLDLIPHEKSPEVLLLGLDQWMFVECWDDQHSEASPTKYTKNSTTNLNLGATNFLRFYRNLFD
nr:hypothetical protein [FCB group bacterium]